VFITGTALFFGASAELYKWAPLADIETESRTAVFGTIFALVGAQAVIEAVFCTIISAIIAKSIMTFLKKT
jgi:hypothetical protein